MNQNLILSALFALVIIIFALVSLLLHYHWNKYEITGGQLGRFKTIYFMVSSFLLLVAAITLLINLPS